MTRIPHAPAGWYPVPGGGQRFWNGREWTPDVLGAPNPSAEFAALSPDLPPPTTLVLSPQSPTLAYAPPAQPPGWYPGRGGTMQWWDGRAWAPVSPPLVRPMKEVGIAYLLLLLLGGFAAHRFYLGRIGSAIAFCLLWWGGWMLSIVLVGIPLLVAAGVWWLVDLFLLPSMVRETNARPLYPQ